MAEEENRLNPSTGISGFIKEKKREPEVSFKGKVVEPVYVAGQPVGFKPIEQKPFGKKQMAALGAKLKKEDITKAKEKLKPSQIKGIIGGYLGIRKSRPIGDKLKVLRLSNMLEKKRLLNQIQKLRLQKQVENLRKKGILKQVISAPIRMPQQIYPAYSTPEIMGDIDSAFNADINGAGNDMWGNEQYHNEQYYGEEYYGNEFDNDPLMHLAIKIRTGISPLLW